MEERAFEGFEACDKVEALVKLITLWTGFALSFLPPDKNVTLTHLLIITLSIKFTFVSAILLWGFSFIWPQLLWKNKGYSLYL